MIRTVAALLGLLAAVALVVAADPVPKASKAVVVDAAKKTVSIPAVVAPRKVLEDQVYPIEVIATFGYKKDTKGKAHETVVVTEAVPSAVHKALESLGLKAGKPAKGVGTKAEGPEVAVFIEVPAPDGGPGKRHAMDKVLVDPKTNKPLPKGVKFRFTGSAEVQPDPTKPGKVYGADITGTLIAIFPVTDETVLQSSLTMAEEKYLKLEVNKDVLPKEGEPVRLILEVVGK